MAAGLGSQLKGMVAQLGGPGQYPQEQLNGYWGSGRRDKGILWRHGDWQTSRLHQWGFTHLVALLTSNWWEEGGVSRKN